MSLYALHQSLPYKEDVSSFFVWLNQYPFAVWLDSNALRTDGRYDILSATPSMRIQAKDNDTLVIKNNTQSIIKQNPLDYLEQKIKVFSTEYDVPFTVGAIGFVSYDYGLDLHSIQHSNIKACTLPQLEFGLYDWSIVIDHAEKKAHLFFLKDSVSAAFIEKIIHTWSKDSVTTCAPFYLTTPFTSMMTRGVYKRAFQQIKEHLYSGNCYQVNLTHTFKAGFKGSTLSAYLALRAINPMPYAGFLNFKGGEILSFSPELFFKANQQHVETQPIKGTAKVLDEPSLDTKQQEALKNCPKNKAENLMIVDLLRNDLSKVCKPHHVKVGYFCKLHTFRGVHHLVSTITGELLSKETHMSLFKALFPGGSITGAPKKAAMEIIDELEVNRRHVYCGAIGYFSSNNKSQFNIAIRTMIAEQSQIFCAAGGGIVLDSDENEEYQESLDKIAVITRALSAMEEYSSSLK